MKILIILPKSQEKTLLATPTIRVLKSAAAAELHVLTSKNTALLLANNPYIDEYHSFDQSFLALRKFLKSQKFDFSLDLRNQLSSMLLRSGLANKSLVHRKGGFNKWLYIKTKIDKLDKMHLADKYIQLLNPIGVKNDSLGLDFFIPEKDEVENNWLPATHQNGYAIVSIEAAYNTRKLPVNRLIELCDRINKPIILIGGASDESIASEIADFFKRGTDEEEEALEGLNKKAIVFNACGKFNLNQMASLIKDANWVFTYDNLMMHIAAAFKKPIYTIWGNTTPLFGTYPYRTQFTVFENNRINCRPCTGAGFKNCPKGHFKCMNELNFDFYLPD